MIRMKKIVKLILKYEEIIRYLIVGFLTTVVSLGSYYLFVHTFLDASDSLQLQIANVLSWVLSVLFAYFTNRRFVFKSKNSKVFKEFVSFTSSRVLTLVCDMAIMFLGVSVLRFSDTLVKLFSQVVIVILNYVISKWFVFKDKKNSGEKNKGNKLNVLYLFLFLVPFLSIFSFNGFVMVLKSLLFLFCLVFLIFKRKFFKPLVCLCIYLLVLVCLLYFDPIYYKECLFFAVDVFSLPLLLLFLLERKDWQLSYDAVVLFSYWYMILQIIFGGDVSFVCLLPIVVASLFFHHNLLFKLLGSCLFLFFLFRCNFNGLLIMLFLCLPAFLWFFRKKNLNYKIMVPCFVLIGLGLLLLLYNNLAYGFVDSFVSRVGSAISVNEFNSSLKSILFGLFGNFKMTFSFIFDLYYGLGLLGCLCFLYLLVTFILRARLKGFLGFIFYACLVISLLDSRVLLDGYVYLGLLVLLSRYREKKKILMVSNMYPSDKYPHYASFVKNMVCDLKDEGYFVYLSVMRKHDCFLLKFISYGWFYLKSMVLSIIFSYDAIYVHFISHSTWPVLIGYRFTRDTSLILNAHGNDVVADYNFELENVKRSKRYLKYASLVVVPSSYFKDVMVDYYGICSSNVVIYPSGGISLKRFYFIDRACACLKVNLDPSYSYIGYVSRIEKDKGFDVLLSSLYMLKEDPLFFKSKLVVVGGGSLMPLFWRLVNKFGLKDKVIVRDFVYQDDLVYYYNAFSLLVLPTKRKSESLSLVGLEAMACGCLVVGCNLYGPRDYLVNGVNSLTYSYVKSGKELARCIRKVYNMDDDKKKSLILNGYKTAKLYDKDLIKEKFKEIFGD